MGSWQNPGKSLNANFSRYPTITRVCAHNAFILPSYRGVSCCVWRRDSGFMPIFSSFYGVQYSRGRAHSRRTQLSVMREPLFTRQEGFGPPDIDPALFAESRQSEALWIGCILFGFAAVVVLLRVYVRVFVLRAFSSDDYVMLATLVSLSVP